jgi:hypothetical protein
LACLLAPAEIVIRLHLNPHFRALPRAASKRRAISALILPDRQQS